MRSLRESEVGTVHAVHHVVFCRVDACISQLTHNVYTRHSIWDSNVGDVEREVVRLFRLGRGPF